MVQKGAIIGGVLVLIVGGSVYYVVFRSAPTPVVAVVKKASPPATPSPASALMSEPGPTVTAYSSEGRRDPFQPLKGAKRKKKIIGGTSRL